VGGKEGRVTAVSAPLKKGKGEKGGWGQGTFQLHLNYAGRERGKKEKKKKEWSTILQVSTHLSPLLFKKIGRKGGKEGGGSLFAYFSPPGKRHGEGEKRKKKKKEGGKGGRHWPTHLPIFLFKRKELQEEEGEEKKKKEKKILTTGPNPFISNLPRVRGGE